MSLIRLSRSVPAPWIVRANSTCLRRQVAVRVVAELLAQDQDAVQRRAQLVRHVGEELGLVLRGQRQLGRLLLERAARLLDLLVLALDLDVLLGELLRLLLELLVGLLQLALLGLQLGGELLRLLQQALGLHRRLDAVEHDADAGGELLEERDLQAVKLPTEASSITALTWPSNSTGSTITLFGMRLNRPEPIGTTLSGSSVISMRRRPRRTGRAGPGPCADARDGRRSSSA